MALLKDHPALKPGSVGDLTGTPCTSVAGEEVMEQEDVHTPSSSSFPSRQSNKSVSGDTDSEEDVPVPTKEPKKESTAGCQGWQADRSNPVHGIFGELQEQTPLRQLQHGRTMQQGHVIPAKDGTIQSQV